MSFLIKAPSFFIIPDLTSSLTAARIPLPQIPTGSLLPIVFIFTKPFIISISSIAPSEALIPELIFIPSRAGPAAQEQLKSFPAFESTISPFVPMSINRTFPFLCCKSHT